MKLSRIIDLSSDKNLLRGCMACERQVVSGGDSRVKLKLAFLALLTLILLVPLALYLAKNPLGAKADSFFKFDEGYGSNVADTNSAASTGTITNALWKTEDLCRVGKCLSFDGTGDYVALADSASLDMAASDTVTLEAWFRTPDITSGTRTLLSKEEATGGDGGYRIQMNSSGQLVFGIDSDNSGYPLYSVTSPSSYDDNLWHHVAAVKDGTASMTLYIDALSVGNTTITSTDAGNDDSFYIGSYYSGGSASDGFTGIIDEVKVMRTARTASEVKADYTRETPSRGTAASFGPDTSWISNGLVGYWKLDETSWNGTAQEVKDTSGNGFHLSNKNSTTLTTGKFGNGGDFVATSTQYLCNDSNADNACDDNNSLDFGTNDFTMSIWIKSTSITTIATPLVKGTIMNPSDSGYGFYISDGAGVGLIINGSGEDNRDVIAKANSGILDGNWHLITGVRNASQILLFIDGALQANGANNLRDVSSTDTFGIGYNGSYSWNGQSDEVRVYNRALSPGEVAQLYNLAPGPVAYYKMDEGTGNSTVNDSSGVGNAGTINGSMTESDWVPGKYGNALEFDGSNDSVSIPYHATQDLTSNMTVSFWFRPNETIDSGITSNKGLISKAYSNTDYDNDWTFFWNSTNAGQMRFGTYGDYILTSNGTWTKGVWYNITVAVTDGTDANIYVNGVLDTDGGDTDISSDPINGAENTPISIGLARVASGDLYFNGTIDDVKIYNYARTPAQIVEDMNAGHPAPGSPVGSPYISYPFNEGYGSTANNSGNGSSSLNGSISSGTWSNSGKFGKALTFTASTSVTATITDPGYTNTLSLWVYPTTSAASKTLVTASKLTTDASSRPVYGGCTGTALSLNTWTHLAAISNSSGECHLYQNGVQTASEATGVTFGTSLNLGATSYTGSLDEFQFYTFPLTADQVKLLHNQGKSEVLGATSTDASGNASWSDDRSFCPPGDTTATCAPIGYWKMDENTGASTYDSSGNGFTGTLHNRARFTQGKFGSSIYLDGDTTGNDSHIQLPDDSLDSYTDGTVSLWFKPDLTSDDGWQELFGMYSSGNGHVWELAYNETNNRIETWMDEDLVCLGEPTGYAPALANPSEWHYVALVMDTSSHALYIDGVKTTLTGTSSSDTCFFGDMDSGTDNYAIGCYNYGAAPACNGERFVGSIDDVKIYSYARTPAQIAWDYNRGKPIGWWKLDEGTGQVTYDSSGNGYNGTLGASSGSGSDDPSYVDGKTNQSLLFDGTADYVNIPYNAGYDLTSNFSVSFWWKPTATWTSGSTGWKSIISRSSTATDADNDWSFFLMQDNAGRMRFGTYGNNIQTNTATWTAGTWYHIAVTYTDSTTATIYVNGIPDNYNGDYNPGAIDGAQNNPIMLGRGYNADIPGDDYIGATIDEVKLFNYPLTAQQVKLLYNNSSSVNFSQ